MSALKTLVNKANQIRNDEHFIVGCNKYIDTVKKYNEYIAEIAIIFNPATVSRLKSDKPPTLYKVKIDDIFVTKKYADDLKTLIDVKDRDMESLKIEKFINHMDDHKIIYDQMYVGTAVYDKLELKSEKSVIFYETAYSTHEQGNNVFTIHNYKIVNL